MSCRRPLLYGAPLVLGALFGASQQSERIDQMPTPVGANPFIVEGDAHYARRQNGHVGDQADSREILGAIAAFETAAQAPDNAEARWKLARAFYFRGVYTGLNLDARRPVFEKSRSVSEEAIAIVLRRGRLPADPPPAKIAEAVRTDPDAAPTFFWGAVSWGDWALTVRKLAAARMGAASRIRDYAATVIALDSRFEGGGGFRILGRLHAEAPKIPMLTWWVSRKEALTNLRRAVSVAPDNVINLHFLAEALARGNGAERAEAIRIEQQVVAAAPDPGHLVEELHIQEVAKRDLNSWKE